MNFQDGEIEEFIRSYCSSDQERIKFRWNGKHASEFEDPNQEFRLSVIKYVISHEQEYSGELLRDLFEAETLYSREAWCVIDGLGTLGLKLLQQGKSQFVMDFLRGKYRCFDTEMVVSANSLSIPLLKECVAFLKRRSVANAGEQALIKAGIEHFKWCMHAQQEP